MGVQAVAARWGHPATGIGEVGWEVERFEGVLNEKIKSVEIKGPVENRGPDLLDL